MCYRDAQQWQGLLKADKPFKPALLGIYDQLILLGYLQSLSSSALLQSPLFTHIAKNSKSMNQFSNYEFVADKIDFLPSVQLTTENTLVSHPYTEFNSIAFTPFFSLPRFTGARESHSHLSAPSGARPVTAERVLKKKLTLYKYS